jgi:CheY-like chemotaxis protein
MENHTATSKFSTLLNSRLVETTVNGSVEERTYRRFGLTFRVRRKLAKPESEQSRFDALEQVDSGVVPGKDNSTISRSVSSPSDVSTFVRTAITIQETSGIQEESDNESHASHVVQLNGDTKPGADEFLPMLSARMDEATQPTPHADPPRQPSPKLYPILSGKTVGVIGFPAEEAALFGQALAAQYCSFQLLTHADAEFRKGAVNGCDLLSVLVPAEWTETGSLHPASLLKTKKPLLLFGDREVLTKLASRSQGGPRELVPDPWGIEDAIWRSATLLDRVQEPRKRNGRKSQTARIVIGDESAARTLVHTVLTQEGMECFVAGNGVDVLATVRAKQADAVIVDVDLPGLDGFQVLAELRRDPALKDTVVILLTARQAEADVLRGFGLGAHDYVTKPFSPMELAARVKRFLVRKP